MIKEDVHLGHGVIIYHPDLVNLYGCDIGDNTKIGAFVEIRAQVKIGKNCKIQAFTFVPEGVTIEDEVFIGPNVCFTNDPYPKATVEGRLTELGQDWQFEKTLVQRGASIGANSTILSGITIGEGALIAAGSVVTRDVEPHMLVAGNPAKLVRRIMTDNK